MAFGPDADDADRMRPASRAWAVAVSEVSEQCALAQPLTLAQVTYGH
jgi:hypothetical protein